MKKHKYAPNEVQQPSSIRVKSWAEKWEEHQNDWQWSDYQYFDSVPDYFQKLFDNKFGLDWGVNILNNNL